MLQESLSREQELDQRFALLAQKNIVAYNHLEYNKLPVKKMGIEENAWSRVVEFYQDSISTILH